MLKKALLLLLLALPCIAMAQDKVAFVSYQQTLAKMPEYKTFEEKMQHKVDSLQKEITLVQEEYNSKMEEFSKTADQELPAAVISDRNFQINKLNERHQILVQEYQQGMQVTAQKLIAPIEKKLNDAIEAVGKENGVTYVLDLLLFQYTGKSAVDLTLQVEKKLGL